jgi:hypothetical protein
METIKKRLIAALKAFEYTGVPSALADTVQSCVNDIKDAPKEKAAKSKIEKPKKKIKASK